MKENSILTKSFDFSKRVVKLYRYLTTEKGESTISKQLLRAGTSIGANACEAQRSVSIKDFANKFSIALKEARECEYWIDLLYETSFLSKKQYESISKDCKELNKILTAIVKKSNREQTNKE